jgi:hypothetical protein
MSQQLSQRRLQLARVADVPTGARVRHFDELDEATQTFVARAAAGKRSDGAAVDLFEGDVVVFTDYFSVSAA